MDIIDKYFYKFSCMPVFLLLVLLILPIYSNTFHAEWQFDDKPNIVNNTRLHIGDLSPGTLRQTFFAMPGREKIYRPLANLSFALNWYVGRDSTFGYHLVNTFIHIFSAFFLYFTIRILLQTPNIRSRYKKEDAQFIALLSAVLWSLNPIQTQAVTYIVQRMASLAGMFYILSIYCYVKGRLNQNIKQRWLLLIGCFLSFVFALMSKENAAILPMSLILVEIVFFRKPASLKNVKKHMPLLLIAALIVLIPVIFMALKAGVQFFAAGYETRPFTLVERLLTQPRVLFFYLSQVFYPLPDRLSVTHDIVISKSWLSPWTTLASILTMLTLISLAFMRMRKWPLLAFAILFFFLNHMIESSIIALELIFEHRNYIPTFFLFLPVASGINVLFKKYHGTNRIVYISLLMLVGSTIIGLGCFTYLRNQAWRTEATLWRDAMQKAPMDARPICNLAIQLAWGVNPTPLRYDAALALFEKARGLSTAHNFLDQEIVANIGNIYIQKGEYNTAVQYLNQALQMNALYLKARYDLIGALVMLGQWESASLHADLLVDNPKNYVKPDYFNRKGFILLWQKKPEEALIYFDKTLELEPANPASVWLNAGVAHSLTGQYQKAEILFNEALKNTSRDIRLDFALIENSVRAGNLPDTEKYVKQLFLKFSIQEILDGLAVFSENFRTAPMSSELVIPAVRQKLLQLSTDIEKRQHL